MNKVRIYNEFKKYVTSYKKYLKHPIDGYKIAGKYINTSLIYFLKELNILETETLHLDLKYSATLFYLNKFLEEDGYRINFYYRKDKKNLHISTKNGDLLFVLNEDNISNYCFKKTYDSYIEKKPQYTEIINRLNDLKKINKASTEKKKVITRSRIVGDY